MNVRSKELRERRRERFVEALWWIVLAIAAAATAVSLGILGAAAVYGETTTAFTAESAKHTENNDFFLKEKESVVSLCALCGEDPCGSSRPAECGAPEPAALPHKCAATSSPHSAVSAASEVTLVERCFWLWLTMALCLGMGFVFGALLSDKLGLALLAFAVLAVILACLVATALEVRQKGERPTSAIETIVWSAKGA